MTPGPAAELLVDGTPTHQLVEKKEEEPERESWGKKIDFLLSVIGFAVDLGNVWRFPYIAYKNGGGAFLIPYCIMLVFGGLPLFYMELALGQYQRCGLFTVWKRICPMLKGTGIAICVMTTFVAWYYNTIIAWAVYFFVSSFRDVPPWLSCNNTWNTDNCTTFRDRIIPKIDEFYSSAASTEFFEREVLQIQYADGISRIGGVKWSIALALFGVFFIVYFALWKGIKSSGKAVWLTATMPYALLFILLIRGCTLPGAMDGIEYYLKPQWEKLMDMEIWLAAAAQIFFSLGPGFGVLLALSSYNKFHNNCHRDALITSATNCVTSFIAGFVVFSVLGYMAHTQRRNIADVARQDVGLIFVVYPEAVATIGGASFWAVIFFFMIITLGLDTTFGALEAVITGVLDEYPFLRKKRELFVAGLMVYCFLGSLVTATYGGIYVVQLFDTYAAPISILLVVFLEAVGVNWIYGVDRFSADIQCMLGAPPGAYWRVCWTYISPVFMLALFVLSVSNTPPPQYGNYTYPYWALTVGWLIVCSSLICIPLYIIVCFCSASGSFTDRLRQMITPAEVPSHVPAKSTGPVFL
ncbi:sodium-dependent serotonin transporter-like [Babylonia areolata]|uniref:sodium-dependent serotonin transporter-like n=1 Tax=Babylonia areolata TaxID=304850 RepID=UPI003FD54BBE